MNPGGAESASRVFRRDSGSVCWAAGVDRWLKEASRQLRFSAELSGQVVMLNQEEGPFSWESWGRDWIGVEYGEISVSTRGCCPETHRNSGWLLCLSVSGLLVLGVRIQGIPVYRRRMCLQPRKVFRRQSEQGRN